MDTNHEYYQPGELKPMIYGHLAFEDLGMIGYIEHENEQGRPVTEASMISATTAGRSKVRAIIKRLIAGGHIERFPVRTADGRIGQTEFRLTHASDDACDMPCAGKPCPNWDTKPFRKFNGNDPWA